MSNYVRRWVITDPYDTNATTNHYVFPRNPRDMTSLERERAISPMTTTSGKILLFEGTTPAKQWEFSGPILHKAEYDALQLWVYGKRRRLIINDHFGRNINCVLTSLSAEPKRRTGYYYSHEYTVTALVLGITDEVIADSGPTSADAMNVGP